MDTTTRAAPAELPADIKDTCAVCGCKRSRHVRFRMNGVGGHMRCVDCNCREFVALDESTYMLRLGVTP